MTPRLGCGLVAIGLAGLLGLVYLAVAALAALGGGAGVDLAVVVGSLAWLAAAIGVALLLSAARVGSGAPPRVFGPAQPLFWLAIFGAALVAGSAVLLVGQPALTVLLFPPLHDAAALAPALAVAATVAWRAGAPAWLTWAGVVRQLLWGGIVATGIALVLESVAVVVLFALVLLLLQATAGGRELMVAAQEVMTRCMATSPPPAGCEAEINSLVSGLTGQPLLLGAAFLLMGLIGPLIEESAKVAGVAWCRPRSRGRAWVWGVCTGAGFGILEAVMFGAMALAAGGWAILLLGRACTTALHATLTGIAGVGWFEGWVERRPAAGALKFTLAVVLHGLWNSLALTAAVAGAAAAQTSGDVGTISSVGMAALASAAALGVVALFGLIFLTFLDRSARYGAMERLESERAASERLALATADAGGPAGAEGEPVESVVDGTETGTGDPPTVTPPGALPDAPPDPSPDPASPGSPGA